AIGIDGNGFEQAGAGAPGPEPAKLVLERGDGLLHTGLEVFEVVAGHGFGPSSRIRAPDVPPIAGLSLPRGALVPGIQTGLGRLAHTCRKAPALQYAFQTGVIVQCIYDYRHGIVAGKRECSSIHDLEVL